MSVFDVRKEDNKIEKIIFSSVEGGSAGSDVGYYLRKWDEEDGLVEINDRLVFVLVESAEHARNLQKALDKAIELGWLK